MKNNVEITKDLNAKKLTVVRKFNAPVEKVWKAWTEADLLDKWWAPRPWKTETISMDFSEGGIWLYSMVGPEGERHYCRTTYKTIDMGRGFTGVGNFCDEDGNINPDFPNMYWDVIFSGSANETVVSATLTFDSEADMQTIVGMGFEGGYTMALGNLEELLEV